MKRFFQGCYGIVMTPFSEDGDIDLEMLAQQIDKAADSALDGLVVCGSTGEFSRLTPAENMVLMRCVSQANGGRKRLICGATAPDSLTANRYIEFASELGADGVLVAPPYYFSMNDDEIYDFYADLCKNNSAGLPLIAYNIPQCTSAVSVGLFRKLLEFECIKGLKNSWMNLCDIMAMMDLRDRERPDLSMLTGLDACLYPTLSLGGDGLFTAITYLLPQYARAIYDHFGKDKHSYHCQMELLALIDEVNKFSFPHGYRLLAEAAGFPLGRSRMALGSELRHRSEAGIATMKALIERLNATIVPER